MAGAILDRDGPRGHLRAVLLAGAGSLLLGAAPAWAQAVYARGLDLGPPFCPIYAPQLAPAIGPSNCIPVPPELAPPMEALPAAPVSAPVALMPQAFAEAHSPVPAEAAVAPPASAPVTVVLRSSGLMTLDQIATALAPVSKRAVVFALSPADEYKRGDLTHRIRLTWSGPVQSLINQVADIYGLDAVVDDTAIRFSSRSGGPASTRTP